MRFIRKEDIKDIKRPETSKYMWLPTWSLYSIANWILYGCCFGYLQKTSWNDDPYIVQLNHLRASELKNSNPHQQTGHFVVLDDIGRPEIGFCSVEPVTSNLITHFRMRWMPRYPCKTSARFRETLYRNCIPNSQTTYTSYSSCSSSQLKKCKLYFETTYSLRQFLYYLDPCEICITWLPVEPNVF